MISKSAIINHLIISFFIFSVTESFEIIESLDSLYLIPLYGLAFSLLLPYYHIKKSSRVSYQFFTVHYCITAISVVILQWLYAALILVPEWKFSVWRSVMCIILGMIPASIVYFCYSLIKRLQQNAE